jgi:RND superfamily putative drug exporter
MLPAALIMLGDKIDRWSLHRQPPKPLEHVAWYRIARRIMHRPVLAAVPAILLLLALGAPFLQVKFGFVGASDLPPGDPSARASVALNQQYPVFGADPILVVAPHVGDPAARSTQIADYAAELSRLPHARNVTALTGTYVAGRQVATPNIVSSQYANNGGTWLSVTPDVDPYGPAGRELVQAIRAAPHPFQIGVTGDGADFLDSLVAIEHGLPLALAIIGISMFILIFVLTGSILLPIKAFVLNMLSLTATFGAMVWVFQEGHLRWLVGNFTVTGSLVTTTPIVMFCIAFGLSMDYEVFLLSRITEEYEITGDNQLAVVRGLGQTGRLVTSAAVLVAIVFFSFVTSGVAFMKLLGLGLGLAVLLDATIVRGVLVPSFMRLLGNANWWSPRPLRHLRCRFAALRDS